MLVAHPASAERAAAVAERAATVRHLVILGPSEAGRDLLALGVAAGPRRLRAPDVDPEATAFLQYTGGTTGTPKGAMIPHRALAQLAQSVTNSWGLPERPVYLAAAPITHAAMLPLTATLARGGTVVLQQGFDPDRWLTAVETERANFAFVVPTMIYVLLGITRPRRDLSALDTISTAPRRCAPTAGEALERFGPVLAQGYGQTEAPMAHATMLRKDEHDPVGRPTARVVRPAGAGVARRAARRRRQRGRRRRARRDLRARPAA